MDHLCTSAATLAKDRMAGPPKPAHPIPVESWSIDLLRPF
jgi:hypothetical protein